MSATAFSQMNYENISNWTLGQNKPNLVRPALFAKELPDWSNPIRQACVVCEGVTGLIKPNLRKAKMNVNSLITKDYRKKDDFAVRINKPNFRNGQNERKVTYNKGLQKKRLFSTPKNKPNSNPILSAVGGFRKDKMNLKSLTKKSYGSRGWVLHQNTDIWWATAPMDGWEGWFGDAGAGGKVTDVVAYSGSNSLEIAGGRDDLVPNWRRQSDGKWTLTVMQYVPTDSVGTMDFGVMSVYNGGTEWLGSIITNCDTSKVSLDDLEPVDLIRNQWKELKTVMDFPNDVCAFYYDGLLLGEKACPSSQAVDIWPGGNAGTIVYYDDFKFEPEE